MDDIQHSDIEWANWMRVMREASLHLRQGSTRYALQVIESFVSTAMTPDVRSDVLGLRAQLKADLGEFTSAKGDLLQARNLVGPGYARYVHEVSLGAVCGRLNRANDSLEWYRQALQTCLQSPEVSCGTALKAFLTLTGDNRLDSKDRNLCERAALSSWRLLRLQGDPDLVDLREVANRIGTRETDPGPR